MEVVRVAFSQYFIVLSQLWHFCRHFMGCCRTAEQKKILSRLDQ